MQDQLSMLQLLIGASTGIGIKKRMLEVDDATKKKKRKFLSNGDIVKRIGPLPEEVGKIDMKVNLRGTKNTGIDFIYDSSTSLLKIQIRYTKLNIKVDPQDSQYSLENLFQNKDVEKNDKNEENIVPVPAPVVENEDIEIIAKLFHDSDANTMYKVKSFLNENEI